ncbi:MAG: peptidoglycan editing factor PgeF [Acidimicrobiia bacterium]|nr:peptidoglycan editing factor PgeF [Acidimicrobiia bacterium]
MPLHPPSQARSGTGQLSVSHSPALVESGVADAVITSRWGGVSEGAYESLNLGLHVGDDADAVVANRTRAAAAIGLDLGQLVFCRQSHGAEVAVVGVGDRGRGTRSEDDALAGTDALVTSDPDVGLVVMVADCVPVVLLDPEARVLACVHAGWRGTVARVCRATVATMGSLGAEPARMLAWLGPAIAPERYEVGDDVADAAREAFPDTSQLVRHRQPGRWSFDLWAANEHDLRSAGLEPGRITTTRIDTASGPYFSDRAVRPCGRFAALARLRR